MIILKNNSYDDNKNFIPRKKLTDNMFSIKTASQQEPEPVQEGETGDVGYVSVGVFTASGALPVPDALITIYTIDEGGNENKIAHYVTDENGQIPLITLPVSYNPLNPLESSEFYFGTYNLRAQAINYHTVNIIDFRIFPDITTYLSIDMIPAPAGPTRGPEMKFVIPPSPIDESNV